MAEEKPSVVEILDANKTFIYALLSMPYLGMIIAMGLIYYKKPDNMVVALAVIFFLMIQYGVTVFFFVKRMESLAKQRKAKVVSEKINSGATSTEEE
ncbi:hypothetical protein JXL21_05400 [Candidatus Bathyarchaeota archaeon]|nr:hypothetical protein [Candidatus Bathyarchaeota archaeon]